MSGSDVAVSVATEVGTLLGYFVVGWFLGALYGFLRGRWGR